MRLLLQAALLTAIFPVAVVHAQEVYLPSQTATVSSFDETPGWAPPKEPKALMDGDLKTRWASSATDAKASLTIDLGVDSTISSVVVNWERAFAKDFDLLTSTDGKKYQVAASPRDGRGGRQVISLQAPVKARYLQLLTVNKINPEWGISVWEVEVYGPADRNSQGKALKDVHPQLAAQIAAPKNVVREKPFGKAGELTFVEYQRGVVLASYSDMELAGPECDQMLKYLKGIGVDDVSLIVTWYQEKQDSEKIAAIIEGGNTAREEAVIHAINEAHKNGLKVMLKPHVDCLDGTFRGNIIASEAWFKSYREYILHFAALAEEYHVELFAIGCELENVSFDQWKKEWMELIAEVRKVYHGKITYAANWTEYETVCFWDQMDFIGIDAYFPVTQKPDPTQAELNQGWKTVMQKIAAWKTNKKLNQPLILTEVGYQSADTTNITPWQTGSTKEDQDEQAMALEAMFEATRDTPWFKGVYWWNYFPTDVQRPLDYTIKGKKAEEVLKKRFKLIQEGK